MQFTKKISQKLVMTIAAFGAVILMPAVVSAATGSLNPQALVTGAKTLASAAPDQCVLMKQLGASEQKYRLTYNVPNTYTTGGGAFFNVKCGALSFSVPRGQDSLVDLTAASELDCQAQSTGANGWCEARFVVSEVNVLPNNTGRGDTFAWDSSNGGSFDWQANTLDQVGHAYCPVSTTTHEPCTYNVQLQARLNNGASSLWVDDLTVRADVSLGAVSISTITP